MHRRPSAFDAAARRPTDARAASAAQRLEIAARRARGSARESSAPRSSSVGGGHLDRRRHRQIVSAMISYAASASSTFGAGPPKPIQPSFSCGRPAGLRQPAEAERQHVGAGAARDVAVGRRVERIVGEHFVADERQLVAAADVRQARRDRPRCRNEPVGLFGDTTSMRAYAIGRGASHRVDVDAPRRRDTRARTASRVDRFEPRQVLEQRIARLRHQHLVAGIAQQLEQQRVRLAGARRQRHAIGGDDDAAAAEVGGDRLARRPAGRAAADRSRAPRGFGERLEQILRIGEAGARSDWTRSDRSIGAPRAALRVERARHRVAARGSSAAATRSCMTRCSQRLTSSTRSITSPSRMPSTTSMPATTVPNTV